MTVRIKAADQVDFLQDQAWEEDERFYRKQEASRRGKERTTFTYKVKVYQAKRGDKIQ